MRSIAARELLAIALNAARPPPQLFKGARHRPTHWHRLNASDGPIGDDACANGQERGRQPGGPSEKMEVKLPVMAMMPPTIVVATTSAPPVMMPASAAMAPSMTTAMSVAAPDLDYGTIRYAKRVRRCYGHCRYRLDWTYPKSAGGKSDKQKPFHVSVSYFELAFSRQGRKVPGALRVPPIRPRHISKKYVGSKKARCPPIAVVQS